MIATTPITLPGGTIVPAGWSINDPNRPVGADNYPEPPAPPPERPPVNCQEAPAHPDAVSDEERVRTNAGNPYRQGTEAHDTWNRVNKRTHPTVKVMANFPYPGWDSGALFDINEADFNPEKYTLASELDALVEAEIAAEAQKGGAQ